MAASARLIRRLQIGLADNAAAEELRSIIDGALAANDITFTGTTTGDNTIVMPDNLADALSIQEGSNKYITFITTDSSEAINFKKKLTLDADLEMNSGAYDLVLKTATAAALEISNGTVKILAFDTRATTDNVTQVKITGIAPTLAGASGSTFNVAAIAALTLTTSTATTITALDGVILSLGTPTINQSGGAVTVTTASGLYVSKPVAGTSVTITNNYLINTNTAGCFCTSAGTWTDTCSAAEKTDIAVMDLEEVPALLDQITVKQFRKKDISGDGGLLRYGIIAEEVPDFLAMPGRQGVGSMNVAGFGLAAIKYLFQENLDLKARLAALEAA